MAFVTFTKSIGLPVVSFEAIHFKRNLGTKTLQTLFFFFNWHILADRHYSL